MRRGVLIPSIDRVRSAILSGPTSLNHLSWLARKFQLGQDALLLSESAKSEYAQLLALRFADLANVEVEYVSLTEGTRENDLKQSRDFAGGATIWRDEAAVRALIAGRLLILDGLHRVDANVLPLLNSLLEAREMQLDDGRLVVSPEHFEDLLHRGNSRQQLERNGLVACHPNFRVLALALPCPPFAGTPLDPPLRSRLQARFVRAALPLDEIHAGLRKVFSDELSAKAVNTVSTLLTASSAPADARPNIPDVAGSALSLPVALASFWSHFPLQSGEVSELVSRHLGPGSDLKKLFGEEAQSHVSFFVQMKQDLELNLACTLSGTNLPDPLSLARELGKPVEILTCFPNMSATDLLASRGGSVQETKWIDSALVRSMKRGAVCIVEGLESCANLLPALQQVVNLNVLQIPGNRVLATKTHLAQCDRENVFEIHPDFRLILLTQPESSLSLGPVHRVPLLTEGLARQTLESELPPELVKRHQELIKSLSVFLCAAQKAKKRFSISNAGATVVLADAGLDASEIVASCFLLRFLAPATRIEIAELIASAKFPKKSQQSSALASKYESSKNKAEGHLVPSSLRFVDNEDSDAILATLEAYLQSNLPVLLLGVQGVGKNAVVDKALTNSRRPRQYMQLHLDSSVQSLFSQTMISDGVITIQDSPLLIAVAKGHVCVLDECDKASPQVVASLKGLVGGFMRLPDGRTLVSEANRGLIDKDDQSVIVVHPEFRLVMLANPGVAPFLGSNVLDTLGSLTNAILMESPSLQSMQTILKKYAKSKLALDSVDKIAFAFADLFELNLAGELSFAYGLREAISVVKDLNETDNLDSALSNVFDYELMPEARRRIFEVLHARKLTVQEAFQHGPGRQVERSQVSDAVPRESEQDPKHGRKSDGKEHVGGNTWEGGTGGSSTAGLGGRHGPYRLDLGKFDVHQVRDEDKLWTDPVAEARARQMAKDGLQRRLKEIGLDAEEFVAYLRYQKRVSTEAAIIKGLVNQMSSNKTSAWTRLLEGGVLDESRLVDALAGDSRVFKRLVRGKKTSSPSVSGKVYLRFCFDCSGSMYRFNSFDQRLERLLEVVTLVMEGFEERSEKVLVSISGHSGEDSKVDLLQSASFPPQNVRERYAVLQRVVAHAQYCWSGDNTLAALQSAVSELEHQGSEMDARHVFVVSDANFRRYGISTKKIAAALTSSEKVESTLLMVGQLGEEADQLARELPAGKAFVCRKSGDLSNILFQKLVAAVSRKSHLD